MIPSDVQFDTVNCLTRLNARSQVIASQQSVIVAERSKADDPINASLKLTHVFYSRAEFTNDSLRSHFVRFWTCQCLQKFYTPDGDVSPLAMSMHACAVYRSSTKNHLKILE